MSRLCWPVLRLCLGPAAADGAGGEAMVSKPLGGINYEHLKGAAHPIMAPGGTQYIDSRDGSGCCEQCVPVL
ncbi:hypothetical protein B0T14DRAFT_516121 [Immersiella caudata]|uniref:Uncharacterized protein n=1 Tax=Immersiella caudata TaxID=314043 RepID=A0AA40C376_9PEZI|nr:hypothetical protein B0T14DRAFT_516121 [Immersiella caudata]